MSSETAVFTIGELKLFVTAILSSEDPIDAKDIAKIFRKFGASKDAFPIDHPNRDDLVKQLNARFPESLIVFYMTNSRPTIELNMPLKGVFNQRGIRYETWTSDTAQRVAFQKDKGRGAHAVDRCYIFYAIDDNGGMDQYLSVYQDYYATVLAVPGCKRTAAQKETHLAFGRMLRALAYTPNSKILGAATIRAIHAVRRGHEAAYDLLNADWASATTKRKRKSIA